MSPPQPTEQERLIVENLARKQAAGRMGSALIMVPILLGLLILWAGVFYEYIFSKEHLFNDNQIYERIVDDLKKSMDGPLWGMMIIHAFLLFLSWKAGKNAGIAVLHDQRNPWGRGIGSVYLAVFPSMLLTLPVLIVVTNGFDELFMLFDRFFDAGISVGFYIALLALVPALFLGLGYGFLLHRARKRNGKAYERIEVTSENSCPVIDNQALGNQEQTSAH